jgi:hypothetical protein
VKTSRFLFIIILIFFAIKPATSDALHYEFSGPDTLYITSAAMDVTVSGNQLTIIINNTSPRRTTDFHVNSPAINGFGFNLVSLGMVDITAWSLSAYQSPSSSTTIAIGGSSTGTSSAWYFGSIPGESLGFILASSYAPQGYLLSPNAIANLAGPYYTSATLTMTFGKEISDFTSPVISFKNAGQDSTDTVILRASAPEAGTLLLLGLGLVGIGLIMREML